MECIQQEGELLYVPEGWYHATVNLGDTVRGTPTSHHITSHHVSSRHMLCWSHSQVAIASQRSHMSATDMLHTEHQLWSDAKDLDAQVSTRAAPTSRTCLRAWMHATSASFCFCCHSGHVVSL
jgi:hypothetical protein